MKSTWEGILASIFDRFWWILGAKLGGKIEPRSMQKGIEKTIEKRTALETNYVTFPPIPGPARSPVRSSAWPP